MNANSIIISHTMDILTETEDRINTKSSYCHSVTNVPSNTASYFVPSSHTRKLKWHKSFICLNAQGGKCIIKCYKIAEINTTTIQKVACAQRELWAVLQAALSPSLQELTPPESMNVDLNCFFQHLLLPEPGSHCTHVEELINQGSVRHGDK